jgi:hypothetical protein
MLFDLSSPGRRRVVKVVYGGLAALLAIGLVFFGIGSSATGGLFDAFGGGDSAETGFEDEIKANEERLAENPQDTKALAELVQLHYQAGTQQIEIDEQTQQQVLTPAAEEELQKGADAWDRYLKLSKGSPDSSVAVLAVQTHSALATALIGQASGGAGQQALDAADDALANYKAAGTAQQAIADQKGSGEDFAQLAYFLYFAGDFAGGEAASARALASAKPGETGELQKQLDQVSEQGRQLNEQIESFRKQLAKASAGAGGGATGGDNPLSGIGAGGLSGGGGSLSTP